MLKDINKSIENISPKEQERGYYQPAYGTKITTSPPTPNLTHTSTIATLSKPPKASPFDLDSDSDSDLTEPQTLTPNMSVTADDSERPPYYDELVPYGFNPNDPSTEYPFKDCVILLDRWLWEVKDVKATTRGQYWRKTFANKGAVKANISDNGKPVLLKKPSTRYDYYAVVYGNTQLAGEFRLNQSVTEKKTGEPHRQPRTWCRATSSVHHSSVHCSIHLEAGPTNLPTRSMMHTCSG